ncbi:hypothetical protein GCM10022393_26740 [Aquimarina addita]|uniref:HTH araC/xylS-type domain-containing protein n=1 Tax=Aquimarina addita TaxID=870485 RepID=A0ABP6ULV9_9FLAO
MKIIIKYMLSNHAKAEVTTLLQKMNLNPTLVELGEVLIREKELTLSKHLELQKTLRSRGYDLVIDKKLLLTEKTKQVIIDMIHHSSELSKIKPSDYISEKVGMHYTVLSKMFSKINDCTIQQYIILQKIERVKHLLIYNELTLSEIAWKLQYSSVAHLSGQFKKITGHTPSAFKKLEHKQLQYPIDITNNRKGF